MGLGSLQASQRGLPMGLLRVQAGQDQDLRRAPQAPQESLEWSGCRVLQEAQSQPEGEVVGLVEEEGVEEEGVSGDSQAEQLRLSSGFSRVQAPQGTSIFDSPRLNRATLSPRAVGLAGCDKEK